MSITKKITGNYKLLATGDVQIPGPLIAGSLRIQTDTISLNTEYGNLYLRASATGNINVGNSRLTDVANPIDGSDAATKEFVDTSIVNLNLKPIASSGSYNDLIDTPFERFTFPNNSTSWLVQHNRNTRSIFEKLTDADGNRFYASVRIIDENSFVVGLTESGSGTVDVYFGV